MSRVIVVQSRYLLSREGSGDLLSYKASEHKKDLAAVDLALDTLEIIGERWDETDLEVADPALPRDAKVLVVPGMRVCTEKVFQKLLRLAERGYIVFGWLDSFYYDRVQDAQPVRAINRRIKEVFRLPEGTYVESRYTINGQISFERTPYHWLTEGLPNRQTWMRRYVLTVVGTSNDMHCHGNITADEFRRDEEVDEKLRGHVLPAFLIREFAGGGMFIYGCYGVNLAINFKQLMGNLVSHSGVNLREPSSATKQIRLLKGIILVLTALLGVLGARELIGDKWQVYLGGIFIGIIVGWIGNLFTDLARKWWLRS